MTEPHRRKGADHFGYGHQVSLGKKKERIRYIGQDPEMCFHCLPVEVQEKRKQRAAGFKGFIRKMRDQDNAFRREVYRERKGAS